MKDKVTVGDTAEDLTMLPNQIAEQDQRFRWNQQSQLGLPVPF
jgi:hypothetical protein